MTKNSHTQIWSRGSNKKIVYKNSNDDDALPFWIFCFVAAVFFVNDIGDWLAMNILDEKKHRILRVRRTNYRYIRTMAMRDDDDNKKCNLSKQFFVTFFII